MHIADRRVKEDATDERKRGVAHPAMRPNHGSGFDPARESVAHHQVIALAKLLDERADGGEVVTVIGVAHDHEPAARGSDTGDKRAAVPTPVD